MTNECKLHIDSLTEQQRQALVECSDAAAWNAGCDALRIIARLTRERDEARAQVATLRELRELEAEVEVNRLMRERNASGERDGFKTTPLLQCSKCAGFWPAHSMRR